MIFFEPDLSVTDQSRFDFNKIIEHILFIPPPTVITITATNILVKSYCSDSSRFLPYKLQSVHASGVHLYERIVYDTIGIWLQGPEVGAIWRVYLETSEWNIWQNIRGDCNDIHASSCSILEGQMLQRFLGKNHLLKVTIQSGACWPEQAARLRREGVGHQPDGEMMSLVGRQFLPR